MKGDFSRVTFDPEKHYSGVLQQQGRVQLDADWNEQVAIQAYRDRTTQLDLVGPEAAPAKAAGFEVRVVNNVPRLGAGRYYVDGILCENEQERALPDQPDFPGYQLPTDPGLYVAYVHVWERHVTAVEDPAIREPALGGPDTASRSKTVWQVDLLRVADNATGVGCGTNFDRWTALTTPPTGQLRARARLADKALDPCLVPPGGGYRGPENRLYRVEVHEGGPPGKATFKWSRDNGSLVAAWEGRDPEDVANLLLGGAGPGGALDFAPGDWVELSDDRSELQGRPGTLVRVRAADGRVLAILPATATGSFNPADFPAAPKVRRWDSPGQAVQVVAGDEAGWIALEDGVEVKFEGTSFHAGDYWLIPARTATGAVEWPREEGGERKPLRRPPHGAIDRSCP